MSILIVIHNPKFVIFNPKNVIVSPKFVIHFPKNVIVSPKFVIVGVYK